MVKALPSKAAGFIRLWQLACCAVTLGLAGGSFTVSLTILTRPLTIGEAVVCGVSFIGLVISLVCAPLAFFGKMDRISALVLDAIIAGFFVASLIVYLLSINLSMCSLIPSAEDLQNLSIVLTSDQYLAEKQGYDQLKTLCQIGQALLAFLAIDIISFIGSSIFGCNRSRRARLARAANGNVEEVVVHHEPKDDVAAAEITDAVAV